MRSGCPSQKMTKKQKMEKRDKNDMSNRDLTNKKPRKPKRLCIPPVKQRLSRPPSKHSHRSLDENTLSLKMAGLLLLRAPCNAQKVVCGVADPYCYASYQGKTPCRLLSSEAPPSPTPPPTCFYCRYSLYP